MQLNCIGRGNVSGGVWIVRLSFIILHTAITAVKAVVVRVTIAVVTTTVVRITAVKAAQKNTTSTLLVAPASLHGE